MTFLKQREFVSIYASIHRNLFWCFLADLHYLKLRSNKIKRVLSKDPVTVDVSFLTNNEIIGIEDMPYCICDLGTEDIMKGRASYSLERDEEDGVFNLVFDVNAGPLWFFFLFCLKMIELFMFLRLQKCFLLLKVSYAEVFSLYSFYIF